MNRSYKWHVIAIVLVFLAAAYIDPCDGHSCNHTTSEVTK